MASTFEHRRTVREEFHDFDQTSFSAPLSSYDYRGSYPSSIGPTEVDANGNQIPLRSEGDPPRWFVTFDLPQLEILESYGDGTVARDYSMPVSVWAVTAFLEQVFELAGAALETYFGTQPITGYTFRTNRLAARAGVAQVGGFSGRTFDLPVMAS